MQRPQLMAEHTLGGSSRFERLPTLFSVICARSKLTKTPVPYTEKEVAAIMQSVLMVLQHCHAMGVLYRDVKPDNFLLSSQGPDAILKATGVPSSRAGWGRERQGACSTSAPLVFSAHAEEAKPLSRPARSRLACGVRVRCAADFGVSRFVKPGELVDEFCGTPSYMVRWPSTNVWTRL